MLASQAQGAGSTLRISFSGLGGGEEAEKPLSCTLDWQHPLPWPPNRVQRLITVPAAALTPQPRHFQKKFVAPAASASIGRGAATGTPELLCEAGAGTQAQPPRVGEDLRVLAARRRIAIGSPPPPPAPRAQDLQLPVELLNFLPRLPPFGLEHELHLSQSSLHFRQLGLTTAFRGRHLAPQGGNLRGSLGSILFGPGLP
mmetsp:Transcript_4829/g.10795  ORF Transcript_4829/g.10795 Transcript_4829/m.10795 type:complete len:200 (-) Transcript_4829:123-722(-)